MRFSIYVVGSNPLPIVIALSYDFGLLIDQKRDKPERILLICSEDTRCYMENIISWVRKKDETILIETFVVSEPYNSLGVYNEVKDEVKKILEKKIETHINEIFINASGGTKVMSTNIVLALIDISKEKNNSLLECDINPEKGEINIHNPIKKTISDVYPNNRKTINYNFSDTITIKNIIDLYNYEYTQGKLPNFEFRLKTPEKTIEFAEMIFKNNISYRQFQNLIYGIKDLIEAKENLDKNNINVNLESMFSTINNDLTVKKMKEFLKRKEDLKEKTFFFPFFENINDQNKAFIDELILFEILKIDNGKYSISKDNFIFLTGCWLEEYVWAVLHQVTKDNPQFELQNNFKISPKYGNNKGDENDFEIDVVFRNGFDIWFISCTTDISKNRANSKTREILANSEALGLRTGTLFVTMYGEKEVDKDKQQSLKKRYKAFSSEYYKKLDFVTYDDLKCTETLRNKLISLLKTEGDV